MSASRKRKTPGTFTKDALILHPQPHKKRKICISNNASNIDTPSNTNNLNNDTLTKNNIRCSKLNHASKTDHSPSKLNKHTHDYIQLGLRSWGWKDPSPYKSYIKLTNNETHTKGLKIFDQQKRRGHRIVVVDAISGDIEQSITFDTWADIYAGIRLRIFLQTLQFKPNKWVIIIVHDSGYNINTEAAWNVLQSWGATERPRHRESYIMILSTNRHQKWWQHIVKPAEYFDKKYNSTMHSWKKRKKKHRKKKKKRKHDATLIMTESQLNMLQSYACNVFIEKKLKPGKGALCLKGFLPKMIAIEVEPHRKYTRPNPVALALKNGIKPCDSETHRFYCVACLNSSDIDHMLVCHDDAHFEDDNIVNVLPNELLMRQETENANASAADEIDSKFRVRSCGQAFHLYCVTYPDQIWLRWCHFMKVPFDATSETPAFVEENIEKQQKVWKARHFGAAAVKCHDLDTNLKEIHQEKEEEEKQAIINTKYEMNTGNIDFYVEDYAENWRISSKIRDLTEWCCHSHRRDHRIFCRCGNPMVQQLCRYANGETKKDLQQGFAGLFCNKKKKYKNEWKGCAQRIAPNENLFRCMNGARCKESEDGWDYCMKCIVENLTKHQPNIRCLCGKRLMLGSAYDVRGIFNNNKLTHDTIAASSKIKKANTYRCAWCLCKFENKKAAKTEYLFYCSEQNNLCQRIVKNHFIQYQPFVVCIACVVQSSWMTQTCGCGSNLHCRLLADWIHHDIEAYNENILDTTPAKPNSFRATHNDDIIKLNNEHALNTSNNNVTMNTKDAYSFYIEQRANNNEERFYNEMSKKYVECALCRMKISAYQFVFLCNNALKHSNGTHYLCGKCAVKQRETNTLFPASNEKVEICLLFVAHDGISQPSLWQKWLEPTKQAQNAEIYNKFGVAVQCNNFCALKSGKQFAEEYRIDVQRQTSWGKLLVPLAIQKSLQISLTKYPNCRRFYIISGREIPLVSAQHLYSMPNKTQLMAKKITAQTATKLSKKRMGQIMQWYSHHAAMCLERHHAEMVSVAPWKEYFNDSDHIYDRVGAPDEFLFGTTLNAMGVNMRKEIWREVTTDFELPTKTDVRHPISWQNLDKMHEFWKVNELMHVEGREKKTLKQYLQDSYKKASKLWGYGPCFFRKISSNVVFDTFVPWKLCMMKPPNMDETINYRKELNSQAYMDEDEM